MDSAPHNDATGSPTHGALVSVVIPCFNQAAFLREAIDSVIAQSYAPIEIVVVDDGSTDDTSKIAASYREVRLVRQANAGLPAARNAGVRASSGEFVICLDADDRLLPDGVAVGVRALREAPEAAFAFGTFRWIDAAGYPTAMPGNLVVHGNAYEAMLRQSIPMHASAVFRRRALDSVGGYDE